MITFNVLYAESEKIFLSYVSRYNSNREKLIILLMTPNGEGCHYIAVKILSGLFRRIMPKHVGTFFV